MHEHEPLIHDWWMAQSRPLHSTFVRENASFKICQSPKITNRCLFPETHTMFFLSFRENNFEVLLRYHAMF